jgi:hypothetical protein
MEKCRLTSDGESTHDYQRSTVHTRIGPRKGIFDRDADVKVYREILENGDMDHEFGWVKYS